MAETNSHKRNSRRWRWIVALVVLVIAVLLVIALVLLSEDSGLYGTAGESDTTAQAALHDSYATSTAIVRELETALADVTSAHNATQAARATATARAATQNARDDQHTLTAIAHDATQIAANNRTLTALAVRDSATETAVFNAQQSATAAVIAAETGVAVFQTLTPTAEAMASVTVTPEALPTTGGGGPTRTPAPANIITLTPTLEPGSFPTIQRTAMATPPPAGSAPSATPQARASRTNTPPPTATLSPTDTPTPSATRTPTDTATPTSPPSDTPTPTDTRTPTDTATPVPSRTPTDTPTPAPTHTPSATPTMTPQVVAGLPPNIVEQNIVVDISGALIGYGTLRLYGPDSAQAGDPPQAVRVELELVIEQREIMPTPRTINGTPVAQVTSTPRPTQPSPTPRNLITQKDGQLIYARMGAALYCPGEPFMGCSYPGTRDIQGIGDNDRLWWYWDLVPREGITGPQRLTAELWRLEQVGDQDTSAREWSHTFTITIQPPETSAAGSTATGSGTEGGDGIDWLPVLGFAVIVFAVLGVILAPVIMHIKRRRAHAPVVFISYRRRSGWATARALRDRLAALGAQVFIDVEDINEGRFEEIIAQAIADADHVIVILAPDTLESQWVRREIATAIDLGVNIIPVLETGFYLEDVELPDDIAALARYNAVRLNPEFFDAAINRLAVFVKLKRE